MGILYDSYLSEELEQICSAMANIPTEYELACKYASKYDDNRYGPDDPYAGLYF